MTPCRLSIGNPAVATTRVVGGLSVTFLSLFRVSACAAGRSRVPARVVRPSGARDDRVSGPRYPVLRMGHARVNAWYPHGSTVTRAEATVIWAVVEGFPKSSKGTVCPGWIV